MDLSASSRTRIRVKYNDAKGDSHSYSYYITFVREGGEDDTDHAPSFEAQIENGDSRVALKSGMTVTTPKPSLYLKGTSYTGEELTYGNYTVKVNGEVCSHKTQSGDWYHYVPTLKEGENTISITAKDDEQYSVTKTYTINYQSGDITFTLSVEAGTVGLGNLIAPTQVTVPSGTNLAQALDQVLKEKGFDYGNNGSLESGFYLSSIKKSGISASAEIPEDLKAKLTEDGIDYSRGVSSTDKLGEFDFTAHSGWMYSYNGSYPGFGMADCTPENGSTVRIRYTLARGKDIGGYQDGAGGCGNSSSNYDKEW